MVKWTILYVCDNGRRGLIAMLRDKGVCWNTLKAGRVLVDGRTSWELGRLNAAEEDWLIDAYQSRRRRQRFRNSKRDDDAATQADVCCCMERNWEAVMEREREREWGERWGREWRSCDHVTLSEPPPQPASRPALCMSKARHPAAILSPCGRTCRLAGVARLLGCLLAGRCGAQSTQPPRSRLAARHCVCMHAGRQTKCGTRSTSWSSVMAFNV